MDSILETPLGTIKKNICWFSVQSYMFKQQRACRETCLNKLHQKHSSCSLNGLHSVPDFDNFVRRQLSGKNKGSTNPLSLWTIWAMKEKRQGNNREKEQMTADEEKTRRRRGRWLLCGKQERVIRKAVLQRERREAVGSSRPWPQGKCATDAQGVCVCVWVIGCLVAPHSNPSLSAHHIADTSTLFCFLWKPTSLDKHTNLHTHMHTHRKTCSLLIHRLYVQLLIFILTR